MGHRIKFNKGDLDFTYGLSLISNSDGFALEVSVNNKVPNFDYDELIRRLAAYYEAAKNNAVEIIQELAGTSNGEVFVLPESLENNIKVEYREGKADIVRLYFGIKDIYIDQLTSDPSNFMEMVLQYCVSPLRRIYAEVYRIKRR
jgi:hypothetical protein